MSALGDQSTSTGGEQQRSSRSAEVPTAPSRRRVWVTLGGLLVVQGLVCVFLWPNDTPAARGVVAWLRYASIGTILSQPMLWAIVTAFGPGRWLVRFPAGLLIVSMLGFLATYGAARRGDHESIFFAIAFFVLPFLVLQVPLTVLRQLSEWRIVWTGERHVGTARRTQFSLRWLLAIITGVALVLAIGRGASAANWPSGSVTEWFMLLLDISIVAVVVSGASVGATPLVVTALGTARRGYGLFTALAGLLGSAWLLYWLMPRDPDTLLMVAFMLPTAWLWIFFNLWVLRWCGFRLVRETELVTPYCHAPIGSGQHES